MRIRRSVGLTTIPVSAEVRDRLKRLAAKGETYDVLLRRLIEVAEMRLQYVREKHVLETEAFVPLDEP